MFAEAVGQAGRIANDTAVAVCWTQWVGLGSFAVPVRSRGPRSIVDPEALILLSLYVSNEERRLSDTVAWWASTGSKLTSLQRMKAVARRFPEQVRARSLPLFAALAAEAGDRRWRREAGESIPGSIRLGKEPPKLKLIEPSALWPRMRAGFGVGAKADALVFLLGLREAWASAKVIAFATGYSGVAVRNAVAEMTLARLIRETDGRPAEYLAPSRPWATLLELRSPNDGRGSEPEVPEWRFWSELFAFLAHVIEWSRATEAEANLSERVIASRARDIVENHSRAFKYNHIPVPPAEAFKGKGASEGLFQTVQKVAEWVDESV